MKTKSELEKIKSEVPAPYTDAWEILAGRVAMNFAPSIYPCKKCNYPVVSGYCCTKCGDASPYSED